MSGTNNNAPHTERQDPDHQQGRHEAQHVQDPGAQQSQDRQHQQGGSSGNSSHDREPHPAAHISNTPGMAAQDNWNHLRDGLQLQHQPQQPQDRDASLANHQEDLRHRLEAVAQRALSLSDSVPPAVTASPTATGTLSEAGAGTTRAGADLDGSHATSSSGLAPPEPEIVFAEPSSYTSQLSPPSPLSPSIAREPQPQPQPSSSQPQSELSPQQADSSTGIWRSQNPFETQPAIPPRSPSRHISLSPSPHHLPDSSRRFTEPEQLSTVGESIDESLPAARREDRGSIYFAGHITDHLSPSATAQAAEAQAQAHHHHHSHVPSIRPFIDAIMAFEKGRKFSTGTSVHRKRKMSTLVEKEGAFGPALTTLYLGISAVFSDDHTAVVALAIHDTVYLIDFSVRHIVLDDALRAGEDLIADYVIAEVAKYEHENFSKFIGAGLPTTLKYMSPNLCSRLWLELDIVPIVMRPDDEHKEKTFWDVKRVDEQADSMARKCIMNFGPSLVPILQVGWRGIVQTDAAFRAHLTTVQNHRDTCGSATWETMLTYAKKLRGNGTKVAFFSSTPQGGGVALMRHALVRFARLMGVDLTWYVPKPRPGVFRITKNVHNILQGVSHPDQRITAEEKQAIIDWITENANRYWFSEGGPLRPVSEGGADVVMIDDPQMPGLIPMIKRLTPDRPVLYRSHIQIRSDLVAKAGSPQADIWDFLWSNIKLADMFISHPIPVFVPHTVPREKVVYFPATTDWLDGLNKHLNKWDTGYYGHIYNTACHSQRMTELNWPARKYIIQVARFDPAKGIPTVIDSYAEFRRQCEKAGITDVPQLVVCGNGSVDDPDASMIYDQTMSQIETYYPHLIKDISVMRLDPNDQLLNTMIANAHVVLQLSTREGFEVKVSEALHAGRPIIATKAGGIPLQVKDNVNGFLVTPGDWKAVAAHLMELFTNPELHKKMSYAARTGVSDEVGTVGNALGWFYLAARWAEVGAKKEDGTGGLRGDEKWVNDMARDEAGFFYTESENRLPRHFTQRKEIPTHTKAEIPKAAGPDVPAAKSE